MYGTTYRCQPQSGDSLAEVGRSFSPSTTGWKSIESAFHTIQK